MISQFQCLRLLPTLVWAVNVCISPFVCARSIRCQQIAVHFSVGTPRVCADPAHVLFQLFKASIAAGSKDNHTAILISFEPGVLYS